MMIEPDIEPHIDVGTTADTLLGRDAFDGLALVQAGLAKLLHVDVDTHHLHTALELIDSVESMSRQLDAVQNKVFESIDRTGVHSVDGHRTAKTMIAHAGKLSGPKADARRETHGDDACPDLMPRTAAQRRADAYAKVHVYAARALEAEGGPTIITNVVIDDETFERETTKLLGESVEPDDPQREDFTCHTLSGSTLPPRTAVAHALLGDLRRCVIGADSVTIDLGRRRLFTGYARLAAQLQSDECYWPGCHVKVNRCQIDHLTPHSDRGRDPTTQRDRGGGATNPHNGGAACGTHNRHKERGYTVTRLADGNIQIRRPDGTILS